MSILTTEYRGTATSLTSPHYQLAQASMNAIRLSEWRDRLQSSSGTGRASSDAADCARSEGPGGFFKNLLGALGLLAVLATAWTVAESIEVPAPEPECREQWTPDGRYVRHCNHFNGRGWVVTP